MKRTSKPLATALVAALQLAAVAAVPVAWTNSPGMPPYPIKPVPHGSTVDLAVTLKGYTSPPIADGADVRLWYQTNGMGSAWWSAPATFDGSTITATFGPAQDCGADRVSLFFGAPSNVFASAVLRLTHAPGFSPSSLPLPVPAIDFATVELRNLSALTNGWSFGSTIDLSYSTNYTHSALGAFAATGTVARATTYGTPTRWTDATGCVWEVSAAPGTGYTDWICSGVPAGYSVLGVEPSPDREGVWRLDLYDDDIHGFYTFGGPAAACLVFDVYDAMVEARPKSTVTNLVGRVAYTNDIPDETDPTVPEWAKEPSPPSYSAADVGAATHRDATNAAEAVVAPVATSVGVVWSLVYGGTAWFAVTNYLRAADGVVPSMQFWEVRDGVTNLVYSSAEEIDAKVEALRLVVQGMLGVLGTSLSNRVAGLEAAMPSKAWSRYQSATGAEAPDGVTVISTPTTMLSANYEWQRYVDVSSNSVWLLQARGVTVLGADSNQFFRVSDDDGNVQFEVSKTASQLVPTYIAKAGFSAGNFEVTCPVNVQPKLFTAYSLAGPWSAEGDDANISVTWASVDGAWKGTVLQSSVADQLFVKAKYWQEGGTKVVNRAPVEASGGIYCTDGIHKTRPVYVNGGSVSWEVVP